ncbi:MAG TPA: hypothetical protein VFX35_01530 [Solirubrobacterales bacterium]|nr:hypothetical protein [Solirubrobacterales bacterium]
MKAVNDEARLHIHRQAMFFQKLGESRRRAREFEATMRQVASTAGATTDELHRMHAQAIAHAQRRSIDRRP